MNKRIPLLIATRNTHKAREFARILPPQFELKTLADFPGAPDPEETGTTFAENAAIKAESISAVFPGLVVSDDSGICAHALDGAPGIYSARFAGEYKGQESDDRNNALLLEKLADKSDKSAHYTCAMSLVYPDGREVCAEGYMYGKIIATPRGSAGFGYDPIFVPDGDSRTVAEMSDDEKNLISHRANALKLLLSKI